MMARQRSAERYDPETDQWTQIANMVVPRAFHGMAAAGGKIYVFGGRQSLKYRYHIHSIHGYTMGFP